jgi:glucuronate isomerase
MHGKFMTKDFLLYSKSAKKLYHSYASKMPIFDWHCHLPVKQIAEDTVFENITQIWLYGDHYKWRAMRTSGLDEKYCTGDASDFDKFSAWAKTVPLCLGNPLYHWTHLELKRCFGMNDVLLNPKSAKKVYDACNKKVKSKAYSVRNLLKKMNVKALCTTDDPIDDLKYHQQLKAEKFEIKVLPAFRPDKVMGVENTESFNHYLDLLGQSAGLEIKSYSTLIDALEKRHDFFNQNGCRLSDHGITHVPDVVFTFSEVEHIFLKLRDGKTVSREEAEKYKASILFEICKMNAAAGWVQQLHLGAMRNNNSRLMRKLGTDMGFDSIGDYSIANGLSRFLDRLDNEDLLAKTILFNLNPADNEILVSMLGNFQDSNTKGKMQYGPAWWFLDQKEGMEKHLFSLCSMGLLSCFVGMVTDSRSFLSYPRHEYFRRILCNILGNWMDKGELPGDMHLVGKMVEDICFNNPMEYIGIKG